MTDATARRGGPLAGLRVIELAGRGPGPFGAMILADLGADVVRVDRPADVGAGQDESDTERTLHGHRRLDLLTRSRRSIALDLKHPQGRDAVLQLTDRADVLIEGFRPGVVERLGLGPSVACDRNPRLVYARMTGFGQEGPYAQRPGHDVNYVALAGALDALRRPGQAPVPPLNLVGDFGGGGMLLVIGVLGALFERGVSGRGQVVDAAMVDGVALLTTLFHGMRAEGTWPDEPGEHVLGMAAPFYAVYETADGRYVSIGSGENRFYATLLDQLGLDDQLLRDQGDPSTWAAGRETLAAVFRTKTLAEWQGLLENTDTCFAPVLSLTEAPQHPHHVARGTFTSMDGVVQPAPAPRFDRTPADPPGPPTVTGGNTEEVLQEWGFTAADVSGLLTSGAARQA